MEDTNQSAPKDFSDDYYALKNGSPKDYTPTTDTKHSTPVNETPRSIEFETIIKTPAF